MRISARGIVIQEGKVLVMFRRKLKEGALQEYYVIPGGGVGEGETLEDAVKRELFEEMNVKVLVKKFLGSNQEGDANYFLCEIVEGVPHLGGEELEKNCGSNFYQPMFISLDEIEKIELFGKEFVDKAIKS